MSVSAPAVQASGSLADDSLPGHPQSPCRVSQEVACGAVRFTGGFWKSYLDLCADVTLPGMRESLHNPANGAYLPNFRVAAGLEDGSHHGENWSDGDCYKYLEALILVDRLTGETKFQAEIDEWVEIIAMAQEEDGYINTQITLDPAKRRWTDTLNHEDYNLGHLFTAAVTHHLCTGGEALLSVARKAADYLYGVFHSRPPGLAHFGWNPSNIMGLVELYRVTQDHKYLALADTFVSMRGSAPGGGDQHQDRLPLRRETEAVGHAVAGVYLYSGAADVAAETGEPELIDALQRIWSNAATRRTYITGGIGALHKGSSFHFRFAPETQDLVSEAFSIDYHLPNHTAYNETCANIGNAMWNWRMLLLTGKKTHAEIIERVIYNSMLSGMSVEGDRFFYTNPLAWYGADHQLLNQDARERWTLRNCYCCPPQVARSIPRSSSWCYSHAHDVLWVHQYASTELSTQLPIGRVHLRQTSGMPWAGNAKIEIDAAPEQEMEIRLRVPDWAGDCDLRLNGRPIQPNATREGYITCRKEWAEGDTLELNLAMPVTFVRAHPKVEECRGQIAVMRGPMVYCLESVDLPDGITLNDIRFFEGMKLSPRHDDTLLGGVTVLEGMALAVSDPPWDGALYRKAQGNPALPVPVRLVPYYAWNNRGVPEMAVWFPWMEDRAR
jgi:DUF1680 family protein